MSDDHREACPYCDEPILDGEDTRTIGFWGDGAARCIPRRSHFECVIRQTIGSVGHQRGACACYGGAHDDPEGMSRRDAARAALDVWRASLGQPPLA